MSNWTVSSQREPYADLEPLVGALLKNGATLTRPERNGSVFWPSPDGWIAVINERLDWDYLQTVLDILPSVRYVASLDVIYDDVNWTAIYGSGGRPPSSSHC